jgi:hypothetical protein
LRASLRTPRETQDARAGRHAHVRL